MGGFVSCTARYIPPPPAEQKNPIAAAARLLDGCSQRRITKDWFFFFLFLLGGGFVFLFVSLSACDLFLCFRFPFVFSFARRDPAAPVLSINTSSSFLSAFSSFFPCSLDDAQFLFFWGGWP